MNTHIHEIHINEQKQKCGNSNSSITLQPYIVNSDSINSSVEPHSPLTGKVCGKCNLRLAVSVCTCTLVWGGLDLPSEVKDKKNKDFQLVSNAMRGKQRLHETYSLDPQAWMALVR